MFSLNDFEKSDEDRVVASVLPLARSYVTFPSLIDFSIDLTIKQLQLQQLGKMGISELAEGDYLQAKENEVQI